MVKKKFKLVYNCLICKKDKKGIPANWRKPPKKKDYYPTCKSCEKKYFDGRV